MYCLCFFAPKASIFAWLKILCVQPGTPPPPTTTLLVGLQKTILRPKNEKRTLVQPTLLKESWRVSFGSE